VIYDIPELLFKSYGCSLIENNVALFEVAQGLITLGMSAVVMF
jgi:hypothetical protein